MVAAEPHDPKGEASAERNDERAGDAVQGPAGESADGNELTVVLHDCTPNAP
jgi:hypothetical protein